MNKQRFLIFTLSLLTTFFQLGCHVSVGGGGFADQNEGIEYFEDGDEREFIPSRQSE